MKKIIIILLFVISINIVKARNIVDVTSLTLEDIIEYLDKGVITSEELVNIYLERINNYNSDYKVIISINNNITEEAKYSDSLRKEGKKRGILEGVPILVKDNIDVVGMPTTGGSKSLEDNYPIEDAEVIKKIKDSGGLIIAKTNMSLFALNADKSCSSYGCVSNPIKSGYTTYGSSGGSAAGVFLDMAPIALGTDTNSSVRLPAAATGLIGLRPSTGIISNKGVIPYDINRDTVGIIAKNMNDTKILYSVIGNYENTETGINVGIPNIYIKNYFLKDELNRVVELLKSNNINIVYLDDISSSKINKYSYRSLSGYTMCNAFNEYIKGTNSNIKSFKELVKNVGVLGGYYNACNYTDSNINRTLSYQEKLKNYIDEIYTNYNLDYILYPTNNNELYLNSEDKLINYSSKISSSIGYPAISIPFTKYNDFYYSIELLGKKNSEYSLLDMASNIESIINLEVDKTDSLYLVSEEDKKLINLYLDNYDNEEKTEWLEKVRNYFLTKDGDNISLIDDLSKEEVIDVIEVIEEDKREDFDYTKVIGWIILLFSLLPFYNRFKNKKNMS